MAEGNRAAVHVDFFRFEFELARDGDRGDGKRFVQLDEVNVFVAVPAGFREQLFYGVRRRHHHPLRLDAADGLGDDTRDRLLAEARRVAFAGDDQSGRAIVRAWSIACGHRAIFLESGLQLRERLQRSIFAGRFIVFDDSGIAFFLRHLDGKNLRFEEAGLARAHGFLVAFHGEAVLLLARDAVFFRNEFASHAHVKVFVGVPQTVVNHRVHDLCVS